MTKKKLNGFEKSEGKKEKTKKADKEEDKEKDKEKDKEEDKDIKKEKIKKETEFDKLIKQNFVDEELKNTMYEFIKMRKAIKKPITTKGLELIIKKLNSFTRDTKEQIEILNNSIMNNWQGIFELKKNKQSNKGGMNDFKELWEEAKEEDEQTGNNTSNNAFSWEL